MNMSTLASTPFDGKLAGSLTEAAETRGFRAFGHGIYSAILSQGESLNGRVLLYRPFSL